MTLQKGHHGLPCQKVHPPRAAAPSPSAATLFPRPATRHRHTSGEARVTPRDQRKRVPHAPHGQMSARHATSGSGARSDRRRGAPIRLYVAPRKRMDTGFPFLSFKPSASDNLRWTSADDITRPPRVAHLDSLVWRLRISVGRGEHSTPLHLQRQRLSSRFEIE